MATSPTSQVLEHLRGALLLRDGAGLTDAQLLDRFLTQRDGTAFAALVRRHGPMVWGVCRRVLHHHHDAEDAFQATFLVLARRAAAVEPPELVANWLYGVAYQTALKARSVAARRKARERQVVPMPEPAVAEQELWHDLRPLLDQELSRLPDKYRAAVVLCDVEGKTRREAARELGWPEGTVAGRLAVARKMLARRLARRGVALSGATLAAVLTHNAAACVPPAVVSSTLHAAAGPIPARVAALTEGVLRSMLLTKKLAGAGLLALALLVGGGGLFLLPAPKSGRLHAQTPAIQLKVEINLERQRLAGAWRPVSLVKANGDVEKWPRDNERLIFKGDTFQVVGWTDLEMPDDQRSVAVFLKGQFDIDPTRAPKQMDWAVADKEGKRPKLLKVYKLEGDRLTIVTGSPKERPGDLRPGEGRRYIVYERDKRLKPADVPAAEPIKNSRP